jgi:steroid 5-alpha reductase family enzyme
MSPLAFAFGLCAAFAALCWLLSVLTREYSWVDRLWSLAPVIYVGWFSVSCPVLEPRLLLMTGLVAAWGGRLTFNYARKGGYAKGGEDYRWAEMRRRMSPQAFAVFNVLFVAGFQNLLLLLIASPAALAACHAPTPLGPLDALATVLFVAAWWGEALADEQQWRFQRDKKARRERGEAIEHEFLTTGLFRWSRHPNFFCEQVMWWAIYLFGVAASGHWWTFTLAGPVLLTLLFQGSTRLTEELTLAKYPGYAQYQRRTSRLIPRRPRDAAE